MLDSRPAVMPPKARSSVQKKAEIYCNLCQMKFLKQYQLKNHLCVRRGDESEKLVKKAITPENTDDNKLVEENTFDLGEPEVNSQEIIEFDPHTISSLLTSRCWSFLVYKGTAEKGPDESKVYCKLCDRSMPRLNNTTNYISHLCKLHPKEWRELQPENMNQDLKIKEEVLTTEDKVQSGSDSSGLFQVLVPVPEEFDSEFQQNIGPELEPPAPVTETQPAESSLVPVKKKKTVRLNGETKLSVLLDTKLERQVGEQDRYKAGHNSNLDSLTLSQHCLTGKVTFSKNNIWMLLCCGSASCARLRTRRWWRRGSTPRPTWRGCSSLAGSVALCSPGPGA